MLNSSKLKTSEGRVARVPNVFRDPQMQRRRFRIARKASALRDSSGETRHLLQLLASEAKDPPLVDVGRGALVFFFFLAVKWGLPKPQ